MNARKTESMSRRLTDLLVLRTNALQRRAAHQDGGPPRRAVYSKTLAGLLNARFTVSRDLPRDLRSDLLEPGASYPAWVRFSDASAAPRADAREGVFGLAVKLFYDRTDTRAYVQDLLAATSPVAHARDPEDYLRSLSLVSGHHPRFGELRLALPRALFGGLGMRRGLGIARRMRQARRRVASLATATYWSRVPFALGDDRLPVKYRFVPCGAAVAATREPLANDLVARLSHGPVTFALQLQRFQDEATTPVDDATVEWPSRFVTVARLSLAANDDADARAPVVEQAAFSPWNHARDFVPLGPLNWARRVAYKASSNLRNAHSPPASQPVRAARAVRAD